MGDTTKKGAPATVSGSIASSSDTDYFKVVLPSGKTLAKSEKAAGQVDSTSYAKRGLVVGDVVCAVLRYSGTGAYTLKLQW